MLDRELTAEIRRATEHLPLYQGGPGVDYTNAKTAYAANITLQHGRDILLVQRGSGDDVIGKWSGVSGYIDTPYDPDQLLPPASFDPLRHTAYSELHEECGLMSEDIGRIALRMGRRFAVSNGERTTHVIPLLGVVQGGKPEIVIDGAELTGYQWHDLAMVPSLPDLSPGYLELTLPGVMAVMDQKYTA
jgi:hypothetical protein